MDTELRRLEPSLLADWLAFFDGDAFSDNKDWGTCYCRCFVFGGGGFEAWDAACAAPGVNREAMIAKIGAGEIDGLLAYRGGKVVGWTQYGPTSRFHTPRGTLEPAEDGVASIVCFVVSPSHRRSGVARALLRGTCDDLARRGFRAVDARAATQPEPGDMHLFTGPMALYIAEGFVPQEGGAPAQRVRLRRLLQPNERSAGA